jgi:hypothetical protein
MSRGLGWAGLGDSDRLLLVVVVVVTVVVRRCRARSGEQGDLGEGKPGTRQAPYGGQSPSARSLRVTVGDIVELFAQVVGEFADVASKRPAGLGERHRRLPRLPAVIGLARAGRRLRLRRLSDIVFAGGHCWSPIVSAGMHHYGRLMDFQIGDIATWATALIALVAAGFAYCEARKSRLSNEEWQRKNYESNENWQEKSVEAAIRSANAAERAAGIAELQQQDQKAPTDGEQAEEITWQLDRHGKNRFVLRNTSKSIAIDVTVDESKIKAFARELPKGAIIRPGASVEFMMSASFGAPMPNELWISWADSSEPVPLPIPPENGTSVSP